MPLARIITDAVEDSLELTIQLRARGFQVETVAPGIVPATPADLEVHLDECDSEEVTSRVSESNSTENLWVYVAPGALEDRARPVRVIPLVPQPEPGHPSPVGRRPDPANVLSFLRPEDDPILAELEGDVIFSEMDAARAQKSPPAPRKVEAIAPAKDDLAKPLSVSEPALAEIGSVVASPEGIESRSAITKAPKEIEFRIPQVPERPSAQLGLIGAAAPRKSSPTVVRISLQTGPRFWRKAFVSSALVILGTAVAVIVGVRPPLPAAIQPAPGRSQSFISLPERPASVAQPTAAIKPKSMLEDPQASASSVVKQSARLFKDEPPKRAHRARSAHADDIIAEDTVVFYDRSHGAASKAIPQSRPRRYSDQN